MADSAREIAEKTVAIACAATTQFVKVDGLNDLSVKPAKLFELRFKEVGIINDAQIQAFKQALIHILPNQLVGGVERMEVSPDIVIGLVVNLVEDLLQSL